MMPRIQIAQKGPIRSRMVNGTWRMLDYPPSAHDINRPLSSLPLSWDHQLRRCRNLWGLYTGGSAGGCDGADAGPARQAGTDQKSGICIPHPTGPYRRVAHYDVTAKRLTECVEAALKRLEHRPDWLTSIDDTAGGLNALVKSRKTRGAFRLLAQSICRTEQPHGSTPCQLPGRIQSLAHGPALSHKSALA